MMRSASEFMASTLNDVLSMQKIEEGKMEVDMRSFILSDAVSSVLNTFRGAAVRKGVQLLLTVQKEVPFRVLGDRFKLEHSIPNLVSNAIKFSPREGTVRVLVSAVLHNNGYSNSHSESISSNFPAPTSAPTPTPIRRTWRACGLRPGVHAPTHPNPNPNPTPNPNPNPNFNLNLNSNPKPLTLNPTQTPTRRSWRTW